MKIGVFVPSVFVHIHRKASDSGSFEVILCSNKWPKHKIPKIEMVLLCVHPPNHQEFLPTWQLITRTQLASLVMTGLPSSRPAKVFQEIPLVSWTKSTAEVSKTPRKVSWKSGNASVTLETSKQIFFGTVVPCLKGELKLTYASAPAKENLEKVEHGRH